MSLIDLPNVCGIIIIGLMCVLFRWSGSLEKRPRRGLHCYYQWSMMLRRQRTHLQGSKKKKWLLRERWRRRKIGSTWQHSRVSIFGHGLVSGGLFGPLWPPCWRRQCIFFGCSKGWRSLSIMWCFMACPNVPCLHGVISLSYVIARKCRGEERIEKIAIQWTRFRHSE